MANLTDYCLSNNKTFAELPFGDLDSLVLSRVAYFRMGELVCGKVSPLKAVRIKDIAKAECFDTLFAHSIDPAEDRRLLTALSQSPRFRDIRMCGYVQINDPAAVKQFGAVTFLLPDKTAFIAYRGTDGTLVGWREDFNMAYHTGVPAQLEAEAYLKKVSLALPFRTLILGGHSKGGNLAMYAAMKQQKILANRVDRVYNHDGPGFLPQVVEGDEYKAMAKKLVNILPRGSIIGLLLESAGQTRVVKSNEKLLMQHNPYSWQVAGEDFLCEEQLSLAALYFDRAVTSWLAPMSEDKRKRFIDTIFCALEATGATSLGELREKPRETLMFLYEQIKKLPDAERQEMTEAVKALLRMMVSSGDK